jgi:hypothetical protein
MHAETGVIPDLVMAESLPENRADLSENSWVSITASTASEKLHISES